MKRGSAVVKPVQESGEPLAAGDYPQNETNLSKNLEMNAPISGATALGPIGVGNECAGLGTKGIRGVVGATPYLM